MAVNKFLEKLFGIDKLKAEAEASLKAVDEARKLAEEANKQLDLIKEEERIAKLTPKELATEKKEPWVAVLETHVNKENVRNGFFELDWNEFFVLQLREAGYTGATDESVVDQWFNELCRNVGADEGVDMSRRGAGYVNRALRDDGKTEVS
jgi:hypothetical protein